MITATDAKVLIPMYALIIVIAIIAIAMPGCTPDEGDTYNFDTTIVIEGDEDNGSDGAEEPVDDDDSSEDSADDDDSAVSDDDDSAEEPEVDPLIMVSINFTTAWSAAIPFEVEPGDEVNFGAWVIETDGDVDIIETNFRIVYLDEVEIGNPFSTSLAGDIVDAHIDSCVLRQVGTGEILAGPVAPSGGVISFSEVLNLHGDDHYLAFNVKCEFNETQPEGVSDAFAVKMFNPWMNLVTVGVESNNVAIEQTSTNGTDYWPTLFAELVSTEEPDEAPQTSVYLSSGSPSGQSVPGWGEVLRFVVESDAEIELNNILFNFVSTDNAGSQWNRCAALGTASNFEMYRYNDLSSPVTAGYSFIGNGGVDCLSAPYATVQSFNLLVSNEVIAAGETVVYSLWMDSFGASALNDDVLRLDIAETSGFLWTDEYGNGYDGSDLAGNLSITGGTLIF